MPKRIFVSDLHMSTGLSLDLGPKTYDWFDRVEAGKFTEFLESLKPKDSCDELILLGDIMDDWVYPVDVPPPGYQAIVSSPHVAPIIKAINELSQEKRVVYVPGNHDMSISAPALQSFRDSTFPKVSFMDHYETEDGILARHGHEYIMWNARDPNPAHELPIGHYISRLSASIDTDENERIRLSDVLEALTNLPHGGSALVNAPLTYLARKAGMKDDTQIAMVNGTITIGQVRKMYAKLSDDWAEANGIGSLAESVTREVAGLDDRAERLALEERKKIIVFGHTHRERNHLLPTPDGRVQRRPYAIYANCGSWCDFNDMDRPNPLTYIVAEYDETKKRHTVTLKHWGGGKIEVNEI